MSTLVYVINQNGHSLMPCQPSKARKLLRDRRAKVIGHNPFTIKLLWDCEEQVQEVRLGIDKGSHVTGFSCIGKGQILLSGEIHHRLDVKDKMTARRTHRRHGKWYRPARFLNRGSSKRGGRLPSSIKTACLMRDGYQCQPCGKHHCRLEAHHVVYREQGGKDTLTNLLTLCGHCHHLLHAGKIQLKVTGVSGHVDQVAQRTMQGKSHLYATLGGALPLSTLFGYQTATLRKARNLPKAHDSDALCLATYDTGELVPYGREHFYTVAFRPRPTRRQYHDLPRKGQGRWLG